MLQIFPYGDSAFVAGLVSRGAHLAHTGHPKVCWIARIWRKRKMRESFNLSHPTHFSTARMHRANTVTWYSSGIQKLLVFHANYCGSYLILWVLRAMKYWKSKGKKGKKKKKCNLETKHGQQKRKRQRRMTLSALRGNNTSYSYPLRVLKWAHQWIFILLFW